MQCLACQTAGHRIRSSKSATEQTSRNIWTAHATQWRECRMAHLRDVAAGTSPVGEPHLAELARRVRGRLPGGHRRQRGRLGRADCRAREAGRARAIDEITRLRHARELARA